MANSGANTNGSQFYINVANNTWLNGSYTVFGMTTTNYTVVQTISTVATNSANDKPLVDVVMDSVRITHLHTAAVGSTGSGVTASVYPNPCRGEFTIDLPAISTKVEITDMTGRVVYTTEIKGTLKVDLGKQGTGLYFVHLANINGSSAYKVVVQ